MKIKIFKHEERSVNHPDEDLLVELEAEDGKIDVEYDDGKGFIVGLNGIDFNKERLRESADCWYVKKEKDENAERIS